MTIKHTPNLKQLNAQTQSQFLARTSLFKFPSSQYSVLSPTYLPLRFSNLKPSTRYKIFVRTSEENGGDQRQEDITAFCRPRGECILYNNNQQTFNFFVSTPSGELAVLARPYGTEFVDPGTQNWVDFWKYGQNQSYSSSSSRDDFLIVEFSNVDASERNNQAISQKKILTDVSSMTVSSIVQTEDDQFIKQQFIANYIQTFFIDPNSVNNANFVDLTEILLYFRRKPNRTNNSSGLVDPGVSIAIVDVEDQKPILQRQYKNSIVSKNWSQIPITTDASAPTTFTFNDSVRLESGKTYGIAVLLDDPEYFPWQCVTGDLLVGTNVPSSGPRKNHRGSMFKLTNSNATLSNDNFEKLYVPTTDTDLKFDVRIAQYDISEDIVIDITNSDQEFFTLQPNAGNWRGDEAVYQNTSPESGSVTISPGRRRVVGNGTNFSTLSAGELVVIRDPLNNSRVEVVQVETIANNTVFTTRDPVILSFTASEYLRTPVATIYRYKPGTREIQLNLSSARPSYVFSPGSTIVGTESNQFAVIDSIDPFPVSVFSSNFELDLPSNFEVEASYNFSQQTGQNEYAISQLNIPLDLTSPNYITDYRAFILSRSLEIENGPNLFDAGIPGETEKRKSMQLRLTFKPTGRPVTFESPELTVASISAVTNSWLINDDATNEHTNNGNAVSKYLSKKLIFQQGREAEDIRVIVNAFRPQGTDFKVYAKILNNSDSDPFDDKNWTELEFTSGSNEFSDLRDQFDYREYELGFPSTIPVSERIDGSVETTSNSSIVTGSGTTFNTDLANGDIIRISDPLFDEQNFGIFSIDTVANNTSLTLTEEVSNANIISSGLVISKLETPHTAYNNPLNDGVVRYFDFAGGAHDGYSTVAVKIVLLSATSQIVPRIDDYRVIGVSV